MLDKFNKGCSRGKGGVNFVLEGGGGDLGESEGWGKKGVLDTVSDGPIPRERVLSSFFGKGMWN